MMGVGSIIVGLGIPIFLATTLLATIVAIMSRYRRCPPNRLLVKYGRVGGGQTAQVSHGGGTFVIPIIQGYSELSLEPMSIDIDLRSALTKQNIRVDVPAQFTIGVATDPEGRQNAAERLLGSHIQVSQRRLTSSNHEKTQELNRALHSLMWSDSATPGPIVLPRADQRPILAYPLRLSGVSVDALLAARGTARVAIAPGR
jgi:uncharacterized membrane protein YqiK